MGRDGETFSVISTRPLPPPPILPPSHHSSDQLSQPHIPSRPCPLHLKSPRQPNQQVSSLLHPLLSSLLLPAHPPPRPQSPTLPLPLRYLLFQNRATSHHVHLFQLELSSRTSNIYPLRFATKARSTPHQSVFTMSTGRRRARTRTSTFLVRQTLPRRW